MKKPTPKTAKKAAKVAKKAATKAGKPPAAKKALNLLDKDLQALFLSNKGLYEKAMDRLSKAQAAVRSLGKTIKADGFTVAQIKFAIQCETPEGEVIAKGLIANNLLAAAYAGADIGEQLSMFMDTPRVPVVDRAFKEGESDAMQHKAAKPSYDPSTAQHASYMKGYLEVQGKQIKDGIKPLEGKTLIKKADKDAKAAAPKDAGPPRKPSVGNGMTHKEQSKADAAAQASAKATADKYFSKPGGDFGNA